MNNKLPTTPTTKVLIIRLSSFGDIVQNLEAAYQMKESFPGAEVQWLTKSNFAPIVEVCPAVDRVWRFDKSSGLLGYLKFLIQLRRQNFTHIYDAHSNPRSFLAKLFLVFSRIDHRPKLATRSKNRLKRFALFKLRWNLFPQPYYSAQSFVTPIQKWLKDGSVKTRSLSLPTSEKTPSSPYVLCAPSAAWKNKRWPLSHWKKLIQVNPTIRFVMLGGPEDTFINELYNLAPERVFNLAGKLSWIESATLVQDASAVVSNDTGILHVADLIGRPTLALIGPTAFGYPTRPSSKTLEVDLPCKPCSKDGRDPCTNKVYQKCLVDITPEQVSKELNKILNS